MSFHPNDVVEALVREYLVRTGAKSALEAFNRDKPKHGNSITKREILRKVLGLDKAAAYHKKQNPTAEGIPATLEVWVTYQMAKVGANPEPPSSASQASRSSRPISREEDPEDASMPVAPSVAPTRRPGSISGSMPTSAAPPTSGAGLSWRRKGSDGLRKRSRSRRGMALLVGASAATAGHGPGPPVSARRGLRTPILPRNGMPPAAAAAAAASAAAAAAAAALRKATPPPSLPPLQGLKHLPSIGTPLGSNQLLPQQPGAAPIPQPHTQMHSNQHPLAHAHPHPHVHPHPQTHPPRSGGSEGSSGFPASGVAAAAANGPAHAGSVNCSLGQPTNTSSSIPIITLVPEVPVNSPTTMSKAAAPSSTSCPASDGSPSRPPAAPAGGPGPGVPAGPLARPLGAPAPQAAAGAAATTPPAAATAAVAGAPKSATVPAAAPAAAGAVGAAPKAAPAAARTAPKAAPPAAAAAAKPAAAPAGVAPKATPAAAAAVPTGGAPKATTSQAVAAAAVTAPKTAAPAPKVLAGTASAVAKGTPAPAVPTVLPAAKAASPASTTPAASPERVNPGASSATSPTSPSLAAISNGPRPAPAVPPASANAGASAASPYPARSQPATTTTATTPIATAAATPAAGAAPPAPAAPVPNATVGPSISNPVACRPSPSPVRLAPSPPPQGGPGRPVPLRQGFGFGEAARPPAAAGAPPAARRPSAPSRVDDDEETEVIRPGQGTPTRGPRPGSTGPSIGRVSASGMPHSASASNVSARTSMPGAGSGFGSASPAASAPMSRSGSSGAAAPSRPVGTPQRAAVGAGLRPLAGQTAAPRANHGGDLVMEDVGDVSFGDDDTPGAPLAAGMATMKIGGPATRKPGQPISPETLRQLKQLLWGGQGQPPPSWKQGFFFNRHAGLQFGLVQKQGGPCGVLAAVQAHILAALHSPSAGFNLSPRAPEQYSALTTAITEILWQARMGPTAALMLPEGEAGSAAGRLGYDQLSRAVAQHTASTKEALGELVRSSLSVLMAEDGWGVVLLVMSLALSRGVTNVRADMDEPGNSLMGMHGYCTQELVHLILLGSATSNVFDGHKQLDGTTTLKGISRRCRLGMLTLFEWYKYVEVGLSLKNPALPVWVICSESHFTVLFAQDSKALQNQLPFDLLYYDELANQDTIIRLSVAKDPRGGWSARVGSTIGDRGKCEGQNIPPLECVIETRWPGVKVNWNGHDPIL